MAARKSYDDVPPDNILVIPNAAPLIATTTGCYVGVNAGFGWGYDEVSSGGTNEGDPNFRGGLGGGQIGCDYQFATSWVIGVEAIYDLNLSRHLWREMNDGIAISVTKADRILLHHYNRTFVIGARTLHDIVTQSGLVEHQFECGVGVVQCAAHGKRVRHIDLVLCLRWGKAVLPISCQCRL